MRPEATSVCGLKLLATLQEKCKELLSVLPHFSGSKGTGLRIGLFATFVGLGPPELKAATRRNLQAGFFFFYCRSASDIRRFRCSCVGGCGWVSGCGGDGGGGGFGGGRRYTGVSGGVVAAAAGEDVSGRKHSGADA
jgi:hypothetical protein